MDKQQEKKLLERGFELMARAKAMTDLYEANFKVTSKYVHATSRGHEAIQLAAGLLLEPKDYAFPYYRDDSILLAIGMQPKDLMLQLLAKRDDPFSGGRTYYSHPSLKDDDKPKIPHQSSATGMQAIPATGAAMGIQYKEQKELIAPADFGGIVLCSLGDASVTEGEVAEAWQMAALKELPILYLVQDNGWDISATAAETRAVDAYTYASGFGKLKRIKLDGTDFLECYQQLSEVVQDMRINRQPYVVHASVPLLNHHTSGVRMEWYRDDLESAKARDPYPKLKNKLIELTSQAHVEQIEMEAKQLVAQHFEEAQNMPDPKSEDLFTHAFVPTPVVEEKGNRTPDDGEALVMVDCALFALKELMAEDEHVLIYGQDVGARLGGVFRETATLAQTYGDQRVFNTPIQEAFIVGSTVGMSAVGLKPIVEVQFADYIWPGLNQLFTEVSRSCYLSNGKWPVNMILRVPIGAYGSGGPYHSSSVESVLSNIRGIKIAYPSNGADLKGLIKAASLDPNPVVILEHKGLYWSKVPGTEAARSILPAADYVLPLGKANRITATNPEAATLTVITYGMGVHWALNAREDLKDKVEIMDLRTIYPLDMETIEACVKQSGKALIVTEEPEFNTFAQALAGRIQQLCFEYLDGPVEVIGSENMPAIPLNEVLEKTMIPNIEQVKAKIEALLNY